MSGIYISAAHKSSGKTTVSLGVCAALTRRGVTIRPYKKGPDYIDPAWLRLAARAPCYNLDFYTSTLDEIVALYASKLRDYDMAVVEGNKGLYDGMGVDGTDSNAALSKLLGLPVVLVIDTMGMTRGIAPLLMGYQHFDGDVNFGGVILNRVAGPRHEAKLIESVNCYTDLPVLGAVPRFREGEIVERHLGLIPATEDRESSKTVDKLATIMESHVDLDRLIQLSNAGDQPVSDAESKACIPVRAGLKLGIARDEAFGFYYADDIDALVSSGVEIVWIDMVRDYRLPPIDGLFIGGGFPETSMVSLANNRAMLTSVRQAIDSGMPCYAECGGLMYLSRSITWRGKYTEMVGVIPGDITMSERPHGRGYIRLRETRSMPWPGGSGAEIAGHEFHYSQLEGLPDDAVFAYDVVRGAGIQNRKDGFVYKNLLASYAHLRDSEQNHWVHRFVRFMAENKSAVNPSTGWLPES